MFCVTLVTLRLTSFEGESRVLLTWSATSANPMSCFYRSSVEELLSHTDEYVRDRLQIAYAHSGFTSQYTDQTLTWEQDLAALKHSLRECCVRSESAGTWELLLEFSIPRKEKRIDCVLLIRDVIVIVEAKATVAASEAKQQVEDYALLLHYFHKASDQRRIVPVIVAPASQEADLTALHQREMFAQLPAHWIAPVVSSSWTGLASLLLEIDKHAEGQLDAARWDASPYHPVPSIIEAALALKSGLSIREIAHSEASEHEISEVRQAIQGNVDMARSAQHHAICFLTGVPGSGKTLVGLGLAHADENRANAIHFMSGNGPLVQVLQHLFTQEAMKDGVRALDARIQARTLIENVHVFAREYTDGDSRAPSNHAIIFDEAQRAWNRAQNMRKFKRDYSEPEMLLRIMERHEDWAVVIALVGGGQEINDGEAGLEEWGRALLGSAKQWQIYASPEVLHGGASTAGHRLFSEAAAKAVQTSDILHLRTSNRSLRAERLAQWVNFLLEGNAAAAADLRVAERFPLFLTRSLERARQHLRVHSKGLDRCGLVASSGAARLRAEGLEPSSTFHAEYPWEHWYLAGATDVRSSYRCEVFATEFEIQGLELDWIGLCWGGDCIWDDYLGWQLRTLRHGKHTRWSEIRNDEKRTYRRNAYRVLLTRARKGMVLYVPAGDSEDPTCAPAEFDATAHYLLQCGVTLLP